jgi:hypothetical protein
MPLAANAANTANAAPPAGAPASTDAQSEEKQLLEAAKDPNAGSTDPEPESADQSATAAPSDAAATPASNLVRPLPLVLYLRRAITDGNGKFRMDHLVPATYRFVVFAQDHQPRLGSFTITSRQPSAFRRVLLPRDGGVISDNGLLTGTVLAYRDIPLAVPDKGGVTPGTSIYPLANASVQISPVVPPGYPMWMQSATTDGSGRFQAKLPAGQYRVTVSAPGYFDSTQETWFDGAGSDLTIYLRPAMVYATPQNASSVQPVEAPSVSGESVENPFNK